MKNWRKETRRASIIFGTSIQSSDPLSLAMKGGQPLSLGKCQWCGDIARAKGASQSMTSPAASQLLPSSLVRVFQSHPTRTGYYISLCDQKYNQLPYTKVKTWWNKLFVYVFLQNVALYILNYYVVSVFGRYNQTYILD